MFLLCFYFRVSIRAGAIGMGAFPRLRFFRLSDEGVRCDENGLFVGGAPMRQAIAGRRKGRVAHGWHSRLRRLGAPGALRRDGSHVKGA